MVNLCILAQEGQGGVLSPRRKLLEASESKCFHPKMNLSVFCLTPNRSDRNPESERVVTTVLKVEQICW